jgi:hypothetical protein
MRPFEGDAFLISAIILMGPEFLFIALRKSLGASVPRIFDFNSGNGTLVLRDSSRSFFRAAIFSKIDI